MRSLILLFMFVALSSYADEGCKVVNGFDLCSDAKIIAENTSKDIGTRIAGSEYILRSAVAEKMKVISSYESIYTEEEVRSKIKQLIARNMEESSTIDEKHAAILKLSTQRLCNGYKNDEFVRDGGSFEIIYRYRGGKIFHRVLVERGSCRAI